MPGPTVITGLGRRSFLGVSPLSRPLNLNLISLALRPLFLSFSPSLFPDLFLRIRPFDSSPAAILTFPSFLIWEYSLPLREARLS